MRWVALATIYVVALTGCEGCGGPDDPRVETERASGNEESSGGEDGVSPGRSGPSTLRILGEQQAPREITITVENRGTEPVRLAPKIEVESASDDGSFAPVDAMGNITVRASCDDTAPECVTLVAGAVLFPPPWFGTVGHAQCACERCVPVESGRYRFVVHTCDGGRIDGEPFTLTR
jgi:hypothetical protein